MGSYGAVEEASVIMDKRTGKSKCFGFVKFAKKESQVKAIAAGAQEIDGKSIDVKERIVKGSGKGCDKGAKGGKEKGKGKGKDKGSEAKSKSPVVAKRPP